MFTQGKWEARPSGNGAWVVMCGNIVIGTFRRKDRPEWNKANAQRIVKCCNEHDGLVEALKNLTELAQAVIATADDLWEVEAAKQAITIAGKEGK